MIKTGNILILFSLIVIYKYSIVENTMFLCVTV